MNFNNEYQKQKMSILTRLDALRLKKIQLKELCILSIVFAMGILAIWTGQMAGYHMTPYGAAKTSEMLDELQLPRQLPNAEVIREDGLKTTFWDIASKKINLIIIYAPWCPACQKELPLLNDQFSTEGNLVIIISQNENSKEVKEQLINLGLSNLHYYKDITGEILAKGKVKNLPTTFLLKDFGKVLDRLVGFSEYQLERLIERAKEKK